MESVDMESVSCECLHKCGGNTIALHIVIHGCYFQLCQLNPQEAILIPNKRLKVREKKRKKKVDI